MNKLKEYFKTLGLPETATDRDIKKAYNSKIKDCHPDRNPGDSKKLEEYNTLNKAYDSIKNEECRAKASMENQEFQQPHSNGGFTSDNSYSTSYDFKTSKPAKGFDIFSDLFGDFGFGGQQQKKAEPEYYLNMTLKEAFEGCLKTLSIDTSQKCSCENGLVNSTKTCKVCGGQGQVKARMSMFGGLGLTKCNTCEGTGFQSSSCRLCGGEGRVTKKAKKVFNIPKGMREGQSIRVGSTKFRIRVKTNAFSVDWDTSDVRTAVSVDLLTALRGGTLSFAGIDQKLVQIKIKPLTTATAKIRLKNIGYIKNSSNWFKKSEGRGDVLLDLSVSLQLDQSTVNKVINALK
jgi:molecular chaperone DnaJ